MDLFLIKGQNPWFKKSLKSLLPKVPRIMVGIAFWLQLQISGVFQ